MIDATFLLYEIAFDYWILIYFLEVFLVETHFQWHLCGCNIPLDGYLENITNKKSQAHSHYLQEFFKKKLSQDISFHKMRQIVWKKFETIIFTCNTSIYKLFHYHKTHISYLFTIFIRSFIFHIINRKMASQL